MNPLEELTSITQILHLTHHRNHNQHRLSKWYSSFSQLRRQVSKLKTELEALNTAISFSSTESKYVVAAREKVEDRAEFMMVHLLPRCYLAFGNLVADNQYAVLGLMLVATLARVRSVLLLVGKEQEEIDMEYVIKEVVKESEIIAEEAGYDLGEVIKREEVNDLVTQPVEEVVAESDLKLKKSLKKRTLVNEGAREGSSLKSPPAKLQKKKKKRKKGDAFDDLFDSLI